MKFTEHYVVKMDESLIQRCVVCGAVVFDAHGLFDRGFAPAGFAEGSVYVSDTVNARTTQANRPTDYPVEVCSQITHPN